MWRPAPSLASGWGRSPSGGGGGGRNRGPAGGDAQQRQEVVFRKGGLVTPAHHARRIPREAYSQRRGKRDESQRRIQDERLTVHTDRYRRIGVHLKARPRPLEQAAVPCRADRREDGPICNSG